MSLPNNSNIFECKYINFGDNFLHNDGTCGLSIFCLNIQSLPAKFNELLCLLHILNFSFDILVFVETWLTECRNVGYTINGYDSLHVYRDQCGGGISIYYKENITVNKINVLSGLFNTFESLFISINSDVTRLILGAIYRSGGSVDPFLDEFRIKILSHNSLTSNSIITGDFNLNLNQNVYSGSLSRFVNLFNSFNYKQHISIPTRVTPYSATIIDHVWTALSFPLKTALLNYKLSDHFPLLINITLDIPRNSSSFHTYRIINQSKINDFLSQISDLQTYIDINAYTNINELTHNFSVKLENIISNIFALVKKRRNPKFQSSPWISQDLIKCIRKKHKLFRLYKNNCITFSSFKIFRNLLSKSLKVAKFTYFQNKMFLCNKDSKKYWHIINDAMGYPKSNKIKEILSDNVTFSDSTEICEEFNKFFINQPLLLRNEIPSVENVFLSKITSTTETFFFSPCSAAEIINIISKMKKTGFHSSPCPTRILQLGGMPLAGLLSTIFNRCIECGMFPDSFKMAKVMPLFKSGSAKDIKNYRPISLLPNISKIFEKIIYTRLYNFFEHHNIFLNNQYGFIKGRGIEKAALLFLSDINQSYSNNDISSAVFLDFSKAFDTVDHGILLQKLEKYGIRGHTLNLLKSYLTDRKQYVSIDDSISSERIVSSGVPQGSCLGPLFFTIYINDIANVIDNIKFILFADDIVIYTSSNSKAQNINTLNHTLLRIFQWACANKLSLNPSKSKLIHFDNDQTSCCSADVAIGNSIIEEVFSIKYLGLTIQKDLKFNIHISNIVSSISRGTGILYSLKSIFSPFNLRQLYFAFIYPHLTLHILAWGGSRPVILNPLSIAQNKAVRNLNVSSSASVTYSSLNLLKFRDIYLLYLASFMFSQINEYGMFSDLIHSFAWSHTYNTRRVHEFRVPLDASSVGEGFFLSKGLRLWNSIPAELKNKPTLASFKRNYSKYLRINSDY